MSAPRKVLYLQHASALGGSVISLLYTMQGLDRSRYTPVVALAKPADVVAEVYEKAGIETIRWGGVETFEHTTAATTRLLRPFSWRHLERTVSGFRRTVERTRELVETVRPDVVHLNSVVLSPSAWALRDRDVPLIWHVRETPVQGLVGARRRLLSEALRTLPDEVIFLSEAERQAWVAGTCGTVVHNFVNLDRFDPSLDAAQAREELGVSPGAKVLLYVGGASLLKGVFTFLEALALVRKRFPETVALMPNLVHPPPSGLPTRVARAVLPLVGSGTTHQRVDRLIRKLGQETACLRFGFRLDMERMLAASDVLVFPAVQEHFARPVVEAGAMAKPVVVTRRPLFEELVEDGVNGLLATRQDASSFAEAIGSLLDDPERAAMMGQEGRRLALERYDQKRGVARIMDIYDAAFERRSMEAA